MVALRFAALAAVLLSASCTSIFDSYFPDSVEYLESQADLAQLTHGKGIISVHMQVLPSVSPSPYPKDVLGVIVDTDDGQQMVVFYGLDLKKISAFSQSQLTSALNTGTRPDLYPFMQDAGALYTGQIAYFFASSLKSASKTAFDAGSPSTDVVTTALASGNALANFKSAHYDDMGTTHFPVIWDNNFKAARSVSINDAGQIVSQGTISLPVVTPALNPDPSGGPNNLIGATSWNATYYVVFTYSGFGYLATSTNTNAETMSGGTMVKANTNNNGNLDMSNAWVSATAAVFSAHADNGAQLEAFSWSGKALGSTRISIDSQSLAMAFHPSGKYWYLFDPATNKISQYKPWW